MGAIVTWKDTAKFLPLTAVLIVAVAAIYLTGRTTINVVSPQNLVSLKGNEECNFFSGKWVYDDVSYPLYKEGECTLMEGDFACERHGRKNLTFQNWRWQPHHCNLPKFDGEALMEKLRNKSVIFVGDSVNRNQWRSFLCLIETHLPPSTKLSTPTEGKFWNLHVEDYNATISFYWSPFLVESGHDDLLNIGKAGAERTVGLKSIEKHGRNWIHADILIFDTFAWWINIPKLTIFWGSFGRNDSVYKQMKTSMRTREYEIALGTWSNWLEFHVDPNRTRIFFMGASPFQLGLTCWYTGARCYNTTHPSEESYWPNAVDRSLTGVVASTIEKLAIRGVNVKYLNITQLSGYREDAHPSIYRSFWKFAPEDKDPNIYSDCVHWCLPGVPDVWNQILYAYIMEP